MTRVYLKKQQGLKSPLRNNMEVIQKMILPQGYFPGNSNYPLLIYRHTFSEMNESLQTIQDRLEQNNWTHSWMDSVYDFHHYHSNTHEVLVVMSGDCQVQFGGENGPVYRISLGDVVIIPAGVAHKSLTMSSDFQCVGAYPFDVEYDMRYGNIEEYSKAIEAIKQVGLPENDPFFGEKGLLFNYWT